MLRMFETESVTADHVILLSLSEMSLERVWDSCQMVSSTALPRANSECLLALLVGVKLGLHPLLVQGNDFLG